MSTHDFLFVADTKQKCHLSLQKFIKMCNDLGVPIAPHKTMGPLTTITFLGIELDSLRMCARLPVDKLESYSSEIRDIILREKITLRELKSIIGKLQFSTAVIPSGRAFLRRLHDLTVNIRKPFHFIRLTRAVKADLSIWLHFLENYNGKTFFYPRSCSTSTAIHMFSDASKTAFGATYGKSWIQGIWPPDWQLLDITVLELYPIFLLLSMFAHKLANSKIVFHCDNIAIVFILNKQTAKHPVIMSIVRPLVLLLLQHNITFQAVHIPGKQNILCDAISRLQVNLPAILQQYGMRSLQIPIPTHLLPENFKLQ
jgi:hypothetical protein